MTTTVTRMTCGMMAAMLFYHLHGTGFPEKMTEMESVAAEIEVTETLPEIAYLLEPVNLDGFMHEYFEGKHNVSLPGNPEFHNLGDSYTALFVNGSVLPCAEVYLQDGVPMVPVKTVCDALGTEYPSDAEYLPANVLAEQIGAEYFYYDDSERCENHMTYSTDPHMLYSVNHVMFGKYPGAPIEKTPEQAVKYLREQLIIAYENQYDTVFIPTEEEPEKNWGQDWDRWRISTLDTDSILCETDRFYVIPYVWEFYVDKYTSEVYEMYNGLPNIITRFDFTKDGALMFPG